MDVYKIEAILRALSVMDALQSQEGSYRLGIVATWSCLSRATCDRYLKRMAAWGLVAISTKKYKGSLCREFGITQEGRDFKGILWG